jgi:uncharacterized protein
MRVKATGLAFGLLFGFAISWGQFTDPDRIQQMLLLEDPYLYEMMFGAIVVAFAGLRLLRRLHARAIVTGEPVAWETSRTERRHIVGAAIFGVGWALADSCPAPVAAQLAQGVPWALFTTAGIFLGIEVYLRRTEPGRSTSRAPAGERVSAATAEALDA